MKDNKIIKEDIIEETLRISQILYDEGVNLRKIQLTSKVNGKAVHLLLKDIKQKGIDIEKIIEKYELNRYYKYGKRVAVLRSVYKGNEVRELTEKQRKTVEKLGLVNKENLIDETIRVAQILKKEGVDLRKITLNYKKNGECYNIKLKEIRQDGIDIDKIIKANGLDPNFKYGMKINVLRRTYNGVTNKYTLSEKQRKLVEKLGVLEKERVIEETLRVARILKEAGVDLSKITLNKTNNQGSILLKQIEQKGIDINKIIEENNLDGDFKYGMQVNRIRVEYKRKEKSAITEKEKRMAEELGLIRNKLTRKEKQKQQAIRENKKAKELCEQYEKLAEGKTKLKNE